MNGHQVIGLLDCLDRTNVVVVADVVVVVVAGGNDATTMGSEASAWTEYPKQ